MVTDGEPPKESEWTEPRWALKPFSANATDAAEIRRGPLPCSFESLNRICEPEAVTVTR